MQLPFELVVALRYVRAKRAAAVSLITAITVGGVAMGVSALTVVTAVWNGFESEFLEKLLGVNAHAVVLKRFDVFRNHRDVREKLSEAPGVEFAAPFVYSEIILQSARGVAGVAIKGVDPALARRSPLAKYVPAEAFVGLAQSSTVAGPHPAKAGILIGKELREVLHVDVGDEVTVVSPFGGGGTTPRTKVFVVAGIFHSGMFEFDARMVFVRLTEAQQFFKLYDTVTGLEVWTTDPLRSKTTLEAALDTLGADQAVTLEVRDWSRTNRGLFGAVKEQKSWIRIVLATIVVVAAFNIVATLILLILEKSREIAVLKSLGASNASILVVFVVDGLIVGLSGSALGVGLGLGLAAFLEDYGLKLDPRVYYLERLPVVVEPTEIAAVLAGAMLAATLATLYPAYKAARLHPVDGLRRGQTGGAARRLDPPET